jgi:DNA-binding HxlR family transcriptional regulator
MTADGRDFLFHPDDDESPTADVIELTSRKWTRAIIEQLLAEGPMRYTELSEAITGISDKMLSESLEAMEDHHLVHREVIDDRPVSVEYSLTDPGAELGAVMDAVADWAESYREYLDSVEES